MGSPVIAWLTDFGTKDHYVGAMKGVALSIASNATFIDITHDIDPQDIVAGALELAASYRFFPAGTTFVAIVDPGVGSARRAIAARAGGYTFVAPDNGILTLALRECGPRTVVELSAARFALPVVSRTFEGRDRFAPAAAWLARGVALEEFGSPLTEIVELALPEPFATAATLCGEVVKIDRFGNAITNIPRLALESRGGRAGLVISVGSTVIQGVVETYGHVTPQSPCALVGSAGFLEIAVAHGNAAATLRLLRGSVVTVTGAARQDLR